MFDTTKPNRETDIKQQQTLDDFLLVFSQSQFSQTFISYLENFELQEEVSWAIYFFYKLLL